MALQEGRLDVESLGQAYELYKQIEPDEYAAYKKQAEAAKQALRREFDKYKKDINKEFVEYRKRFTPEANRVIRFNGSRVDESRLDLLTIVLLTRTSVTLKPRLVCYLRSFVRRRNSTANRYKSVNC